VQLIITMHIGALCTVHSLTAHPPQADECFEQHPVSNLLSGSDASGGLLSSIHTIVDTLFWSYREEYPRNPASFSGDIFVQNRVWLVAMGICMNVT